MDASFRLHRRFDRIGRLFGDVAMSRLQNTHVVVIGLGGVGSLAAESLVRSGVGRITLVDFDLVCVTNVNRQLQAMRGNVGKPKASVLAERLRKVNPAAEIKAVPLFYEARLADRMLGDADWVVDAIDNLTAKAHLVAECRRRDIPIVVSTGASGRMDPTRIRITDLNRTTVDPLAASLRKILRQKHAFPRGKSKWRIPAVFSDETLAAPVSLAYDGDTGFDCVCPNGDNDVHTCEDRNVIWGTAGFVTGAFGLACASVVVRGIVADDPLAAVQRS
ncbi:MAG TPA: tRNA threonylcarbamoyladenosine dehydratase [Deltaproteobacteria bacterium]|nr:tRNA threonylcarbamoyladenosine dehydratase [Deltaproteobacteria bacterium]